MSNEIDMCGKCPFLNVPPDHLTAPATCGAPESAPGKNRPVITDAWNRHKMCPMVGVAVRWSHEPGAEEGVP